MTGTLQAMALSAARPNDSASEGRSISRAAGRIVSIAATLPRKVADAKPPRQPLGEQLRAVPGRRAGIAADALETASTSRTQPTGRVETHDERFSVARESAEWHAPSGRYCCVSTKFGTTSILLNFSPDRDVLQVLRYRRHGVALVDRPPRDRRYDLSWPTIVTSAGAS
jgi:hypothetical protein